MNEGREITHLHRRTGRTQLPGQLPGNGRCSGKSSTLIGPLLSVRKPTAWGRMSNYRKDTCVQSIVTHLNNSYWKLTVIHFTPNTLSSLLLTVVSIKVYI